MLKISKILFPTLLLVGSVIGAGFVSGKEILVFLGKAKGGGILLSVLVGVGAFAFSHLFLSYGNDKNLRSIDDFGVRLFGKRYGFLITVCYLFCCFTTLLAMMSGIDALFFSAHNVNMPIFSYIAYFLITPFVIKGIKGVQVFNFFITPVLIALIILVCLPLNSRISFNGLNLSTAISPFMYIAMNFSGISFVLVEVGKDMQKDEIVLSSVISSIIIALLLYFLYSSLKKSQFVDFDLPLMELAKAKGKGSYCFFALFFGIITTLITSYHALYTFVEQKFKDKTLTVLSLFFACYSISRMGFSKVVGYLYPVQSVFGAIVFLTAVSKRTTYNVSSNAPKVKLQSIQRRIKGAK